MCSELILLVYNNMLFFCFYLPRSCSWRCPSLQMQNYLSSLYMQSSGLVLVPPHCSASTIQNQKTGSCSVPWTHIRLMEYGFIFISVFPFFDLRILSMHLCRVLRYSISLSLSCSSGNFSNTSFLRVSGTNGSWPIAEIRSISHRFSSKSGLIECPKSRGSVARDKLYHQSDLR